MEQIRGYDCENHIYFMTTSDDIIRRVRAYDPDLPVCVGYDGNKNLMVTVDRCYKVHFSAITSAAEHRICPPKRHSLQLLLRR